MFWIIWVKDSRVQRRLCLYRPHMNSPQRSHQLSCVWLQGWKSWPRPGLHVGQSGSSRRTRSPTIRTTFSLPHLSRVGEGPLGGANSMRSSGVKSCNSMSSHFAILGMWEAKKHHFKTTRLTRSTDFASGSDAFAHPGWEQTWITMVQYYYKRDDFFSEMSSWFSFQQHLAQSEEKQQRLD